MKLIHKLAIRIFVLFTILSFCYFAQQQFGKYQWEASYLFPLFIVSLIYLIINFIGACIWFLLLTGVNEPHQFSAVSRVFFISQIGKYTPGNIVHLIGRVANAKSVGFRATSVLYTLTFEIILLVLSAAIFAAITIYYSELNLFSGYVPNLIKLLAAGLVCLAITALIIFFSPKLSERLGRSSILNIPKVPTLKILVLCLCLFWICYLLLGLSLNFLAESIFAVEFNNIVLISGIVTISFVAGFLTPGAPAGFGVREFMMVLLLTPFYGELCAVGVAGLSRISQMLGDLFTLLIGVLIPKKKTVKNKRSDYQKNNHQLSIIYWGTYDESKPRNPILHDSLKQVGCSVITCHESIWAVNNDKSQIKGMRNWTSIACRYLLAYPKLVVNLFKLKKSDFIMVGYLGHLDIFVLWPFARLRGIPIVWDAFISLYNTTVEDRKMFGKHHPVSVMLYAWEWLACRMADAVLLDTNEHADYFRRKFQLDDNKVHYTFVGAEERFFQRPPNNKITMKNNGPIEVLFYGTFIPLHGISTIIKACRLVPSEMANWTIIGKGQEALKIQAELDSNHIYNLKWIKWVPYEKLSNKILEADVCLGIFGNTEKSAMVIPNKTFQIIAAGKPIITRNSPAIVELLNNKDTGVWLVPPEDESALAQAIKEIYDQQAVLRGLRLHSNVLHRIKPEAIGSQLIDSLYRNKVISYKS